MSKNWEIHSHREQSLPYSIVAVIAWRQSVCLCWMCGIYCWVRLSRTTGSIVNTWLRLFGGIQPPRLVSVLPVQKQDSLDRFCLSNKDLSLKFILFFERRGKITLQFASTTTVEVLYMLRPFPQSGYLLSEAVVVSGGEIYLPLIIINYMLVWMERKKKLWMEIDIPMLGLLSYCAVGDVYYMFHGLCALNIFLWGIPMWRRDIFFYSPSIRSVVACKFLWMCCTGFPLYL